MAESAPDPTDRFLAAHRKLVLLTFPAIKFMCPWGYTVQGIEQDGSLDLSPVDTSSGMPDLSHVPILSGIPGATVKPQLGSTAIVSFLGGDPTQPRVVGFDGNSAQSVTIDCGTGNLEHIATVEGVCAILVGCGFDVGASTPVTDATLAGLLATAATTSIPLSAAAIKTALATKTGDAVVGGVPTTPNLGCANHRGG